MIIAYLRNMNKARRPSGNGNVENGERAVCRSSARRATASADSGGRLGPDLTRIGVQRSRDAFTREIRTPSEWMPPGYETVTIVTKTARRSAASRRTRTCSRSRSWTRASGSRVSKCDLQEVIYEKTSLMPEYPSERLSDSDMTDLVGYLARCAASATRRLSNITCRRVTRRRAASPQQRPAR